MTPSSALAGITVLEICNVAAGPFCGMLLADMGADVIKVENPDGGDTLRSWPPISDGYSENFASLNRNKRSVTLNLKDPGDLELARELALTVDVLIENNRPGVMDRLGLGYEALKARNPRLVYCSISAYGQSGPRAQEGGFDLTIQAMSGIMSVTGEAGGEPVKCGVPLADSRPGCTAPSPSPRARAAQASGQGAHIDVPMLGATLGIAALQTSEFFGSGRDPVKLGSAHPRNAPYQAFRCKGGYFGMAAGNQALWKSVCAVVGRDDLLADARFADTSLRARNRRAARDPGSHLRRRRGRVLAGALSRGGRALRADQHLFGSAGRSAGRAHGLGAAAGTAQRRAHAHLCRLTARPRRCVAVRPRWASTTRSAGARARRKEPA